MPTPGLTVLPPVAECSAARTPVDVDLDPLPAPVRETAHALLVAAVTCDADALVALAQADGVNLTFGDTSAAEFWALPGAEEHEPVYSILATLITATRWAATPEGLTADTWVWPRVFSPEWAGTPEAWDEVVDAGLLDAGLATQMREQGAYLGWRLGIGTDGSWRFFVAGD